MDELSQIVQNFIDKEKELLIKRLCHNEVSLLNKEQELINEYITCNHMNKKIKLSDDFESMDFLNNDASKSISPSPPIKIQNINDTENTNDIDIDSLNDKFKNMSLKEIQNICTNKSIVITKISQNTRKQINKTKKELIQVLISVR